MAKLKVGDVVRIQGGPLMTVEQVREDRASCVWFVKQTDGWTGPFRAEFRSDTFTFVKSIASRRH